MFEAAYNGYIAKVCLQAIDAVRNGELVECSKQEYEDGVRNALQRNAGTWIESGDAVRATIALEEVKRLDTKFAEAA